MYRISQFTVVISIPISYTNLKRREKLDIIGRISRIQWYLWGINMARGVNLLCVSYTNIITIIIIIIIMGSIPSQNPMHLRFQSFPHSGLSDSNPAVSNHVHHQNTNFCWLYLPVYQNFIALTAVIYPRNCRESHSICHQYPWMPPHLLYLDEFTDQQT